MPTAWITDMVIRQKHCKVSGNVTHILNPRLIIVGKILMIFSFFSRSVTLLRSWASWPRFSTCWRSTPQILIVNWYGRQLRNLCAKPLWLNPRTMLRNYWWRLKESGKNLWRMDRARVLAITEREHACYHHGGLTIPLSQTLPQTKVFQPKTQLLLRQLLPLHRG